MVSAGGYCPALRDPERTGRRCRHPADCQSGVKAVAEAPTCADHHRRNRPVPGSCRVLFALGKAANAGGAWRFRGAGAGAERRAHGLGKAEKWMPVCIIHAPGHPPRLRAVRRRSEADQPRARARLSPVSLRVADASAGPGRRFNHLTPSRAAALPDASHDVMGRDPPLSQMLTTVQTGMGLA